MTLCKVLN